MKQIRKRRRHFRVNSPVAFGVLCALILLLLAGGVYALAAGVVAPAVQKAQEARITPSPAPPAATGTPAAEPPATASPEPSPSASPEPDELSAVAGHIIALDAARNPDSTLKGVSTGIYEYKTNLAITLLVREKLIEKGATVVLTRVDYDDALTDAQRAAIINDASAEVALRLFCNHVETPEKRGAQAFVPAAHSYKTDSDRLARYVLNAYVGKTELPLCYYYESTIRSDKTFEFFTLCRCPVASLVLGHLSNETDDKLLNNEEFREQIADGIVAGLEAYFAQKSN